MLLNYAFKLDIYLPALQKLSARTTLKKSHAITVTIYCLFIAPKPDIFSTNPRSRHNKTDSADSRLDITNCFLCCFYSWS